MNTTNALQQSWNADATGERNGDDAYAHIPSSTSSFTAINQPLTQFSTAASPKATPIQQNEARRRATVHRRRHNSAVAQYLGLGTASEPTHLEIYASSLATPASPPLKPTRKRQRLAAHGNKSDCKRTNAEGTGVNDQHRVSDSFRVTKPARNSAVSRSKASRSGTTQSSSIDDARSRRLTADGDKTTVSDPVLTVQLCDVANHRFSSPETVRNVSQDTVGTLPTQHPVDARLFDLEGDDYNANGTGHVDVSLAMQQSKTPLFAEDDFDFDIDDEELLTLTSVIDGACSTLAKHASSSSVHTGNDGDCELHHVPDPSAETPIMFGEDTAKKSSKRISKQFTSPVTLTTRLQVAQGDPGSVMIRKPIARPPFPEAVRDRSPIIGLSSKSVLRTCFRIGEVINQSSQASKSGKHMMIEMYARVLASERTDMAQQFTFCDLFHAKAPYIKGVYSAAIWKSVELFEYDGRRLLQQGRICRCIGTMKREEKVWTMTVLNIWEATWEDIEWVEGIVNC